MSKKADCCFAIKSYTLNDRMKDYARQLHTAKQKGYALGGVSDFWLDQKDSGPLVVLRHDVDVMKIGVEETLRIEQSLGAKATYYFRWSSADDQTVSFVKKAGFEVGLHFETLALLAEERRLSDPMDVTAEILSEAKGRLKDEIKLFRERFDVPCRTIASHGHTANYRIQMSNNQLIGPDDYSFFDIDLEAYDSRLLNLFDCYISDSPPHHNGGWRYGMTLTEACEKRINTICFLSHPNNWFFSTEIRLLSLVRIALKGVVRKEEVFHSCFPSAAGRE